MIRLAWSLNAADVTEPAAIAERAIESKVGGIDLSAATADAALVAGQQLLATSVPVICLATMATLPMHLGSDSAWLDPARHWALAAAQLGADTLRVHVTHDPSARTRPSPVRLADQLAGLAELAGQQHVRIVLETRGEFAATAALWRVLDLSGSSNLSACCSINTVAELSRREMVAATTANVVSTLNLRIRYVHARAAPHEPLGRRAVATIRHLRGIGYDGWIALQTDRESIVTIADTVRKIIASPKAKAVPAAAVHKK